MEYQAILNLFFDIILITLPCISYFIQISSMVKAKSSEGFSKTFVFIMLLASILRIVYWLDKRFAMALLVQAFINIFIQFYLLYICLLYSRKNETQYSYKILKINVSVLNGKRFWNWPNFSDFVTFFVFIVITLISITSLFRMSKAYFEFIGFCSGIIEAFVGFPQILANYKNKSTGSLSIGMIYLWFYSDSFKNVYNFMNHAPLPLIMCSIIQLMSDITILFQIYYYKDKQIHILHQQSQEDYPVFLKENNQI